MKGRSMSATKPLWTTFLRFLAPLMLSNALQSLFGTVSNVYLGQMIGVDALAAVSTFFPVMFFLFAFVGRDARWRRRANADAVVDLRHRRDRIAVCGDLEPHRRPPGRLGGLSDRVLRHVHFTDRLLPVGLAQAVHQASDLTGSSRYYDRH
jgi:hypothetical protein